MKCATRWVGIVSVVLLAAGQLRAQGDNSTPKQPSDATAATPVVSAAPAASAEAPVAASDSQDALVSEIKTLEGLRRSALQDYGMTCLAAGRKELRDGDYEEARKQYELADKHLPDNPETRAARTEAKDGIRQALYLNAQVTWKKGDREKALQLARQASEKGHPDAAKLATEIQNEIENPAKVAQPKEMARMFEATYKDDRDGVMRHLRVARQYYIVGDYDRSRQELEVILRDHPYNTEAMEMLEKLGDRTYDISSDEFDATRSRMIRDVVATWSPRRYALDTVNIKESAAGQSTERVLLPGGITVEQSVEAKMRRIVLPEINFRNANITDVINFFEASSREYDDPSLPIEKRGVNFVLRGFTAAGAVPAAATPAAAAAAPAPAAPDPFAGAEAAAPATGGITPITFSARFVSIWDALKIVTEVANFKYRIRGNVVVVMPHDVTDETMETRTYTVMPSIMERAAAGAAMGGAAPAGGAAAGPAAAAGGAAGGGAMAVGELGSSVDPMKIFTAFGVTFPKDSSISYLSGVGKLRVCNTVDNLAIFEKVLDDLNVIPKQIEIEARFVEVSQTDLDELGVEWINNKAIHSGKDGVNMVQMAASSPATSATPDVPAHVQVVGGVGYLIPDQPATAGSAAIGQGLRFLNQGASGPLGDLGTTPNDALLSLRGVFEKFDVTAILHALSQRSSTDLLSAPKVVTKAGQQATMKVVTEYIYPTTFTLVTTSTTSASTGGTVNAPPPGVEPGGFTMREVGVILQVVPDVSADGQMITLTMNPEVVSDPIWHDYGYDVSSSTTASGLIHLAMPQPFFKVRSVNTSVSIYNGATVVMGGMITENRLASLDKIPLLGDLPYFGQFFSNKAEQTDKRNLLIFVTARLVDPAGRSVKTQTESLLGPVAKPKNP